MWSRGGNVAPRKHGRVAGLHITDRPSELLKPSSTDASVRHWAGPVAARVVGEPYSVTGCGTDFLPWKWAEMDRAAGEVAA